MNLSEVNQNSTLADDILSWAIESGGSTKGVRVEGDKVFFSYEDGIWVPSIYNADHWQNFIDQHHHR